MTIGNKALWRIYLILLIFMALMHLWILKFRSPKTKDQIPHYLCILIMVICGSIIMIIEDHVTTLTKAG